MTTLPASIADYAVVPNAALTLLVPLTQYQEAGLAHHLWRIAMGYTVAASSNGTVASAGDNVAALADIVPGASGVDPHTWILYVRGSTWILDDYSDASVTPQLINIGRSEAPYVGFGSTVNPPTTTVGYGATAGALTLIPWTDGRAGQVSYSHAATAGIGWFFVKEIGLGNTGYAEFVDAPVASDPIRDNSAPIAVVIDDSLIPVAQQVGTMLLPASTNLAGSTGSYYSDGSDPGGPVFADGLARLDKAYMLTPSGTPTDARCNGESRIIMYITPGNPWNARNPADPPGDPFTWWTIGEVVLLWPKAAGDML